VTLLESLYNVAANVARPLLPVAGAFPPKVAAAAAGRRTATTSIREWATRGRDSTRPLLWLHGASVGELTGALPVVAAIRERFPGLQLLVTHSSPSARSATASLSADYAGYTPFDSYRECLAALRAADPAAVVFAKGDAWPNFTRAAAALGVPLGMINTTLRTGSGLLRPAGRALMGPAYRRLRLVGVATASDTDRLASLGVPPDRVSVTGDAAFETALVRADAARRSLSGGLRYLPPSPPGAIRIVAGSTWRKDEEALIGAIGVLAEAGPATELVLVPHEPNDAALQRIAELCRAELRQDPRLYSELGESPRADWPAAPEAFPLEPPLVVDAVGILPDLYLEGEIGLVGGAFGGEGLHSVVEPAAAGVPVVFGPLSDRWEADELVAGQGAIRLDSKDPALGLRALLSEPDRCRAMGEAARRCVESGRGAAEAGADLVERLIRGRLPDA
jgi:3-deoxy-D-manno-octulosonic-acid transferase